jgi:hypothetical protein
VNPTLRVVVRLVLPLALAASAAAQAVLVVGPVAGPGIDYTSLPAATAAAASGDVVLVLPGDYPGVASIAAKSLSVMAVPGGGGARPQIETIVVRNTQPGQTVLLRGLGTLSQFLSSSTPLFVLDSSGAVLVEDCVLDMHGFSGGSGDDSLIVKDSTRVVFSRCTLVGASGSQGPFFGSPSGPGSPALACTQAAVTLDACSVNGGAGQQGVVYPAFFTFTPASVGGPAVLLAASTLTVRGSALTGGHGGNGAAPIDVNPACVPPAAGGDGIDGNGLLRLLDSTLVPGTGGTPQCNVTAPAGVDVNLSSGSIVNLSGHVGTLTLSAAIEDGGGASLSVHGTPGDMAVLFHALSGLGAWLGSLKGTLVPSVPLITVPLGVVPVGGEIAIDFDIPPVLAPGIDGVILVNQVALLPPGGHGVLSSASTSVLVRDVP